MRLLLLLLLLLLVVVVVVVVVVVTHDHLDWPRLFYKEQFKEGDEEADRGNDGKTTSKSGLALNRSYYGKPRTARR